MALKRTPAGTKARSNLLSMIQVCEVFEKLVIIEKGKSWPLFNERLHGTIDIWWTFGGGGVLLLFPFLLTKHPVWSGCRTRLFVLAGADDDLVQMKKELDMYVHDFRLPIEVHIKVNDEIVAAAMASVEEEPEVQYEDEEVPLERNAASFVVRPLVREISKDYLDYNSHSQISKDGLTRTVSGQELTRTVSAWRDRTNMDQKEAKTVLFLHNPDQLTSSRDCNLAEMEVATALNKVMREISSEAELVVTNLPDMNPGQNALGYCQYVEELTKELRVILLRGTNTEVITAFT